MTGMGSSCNACVYPMQRVASIHRGDEWATSKVADRGYGACNVRVP
jgi:hypothetical protein